MAEAQLLRMQKMLAQQQRVLLATQQQQQQLEEQQQQVVEQLSKLSGGLINAASAASASIGYVRARIGCPMAFCRWLVHSSLLRHEWSRRESPRRVFRFGRRTTT